MNKLSLILILSLLVFFTSCSKDNNDENLIELTPDAAGQIPGLGETSGEPTGEKFQLPQGIELDGEITGYNGDRETQSKSSSHEVIKASLEKSFLKSNNTVDVLNTQIIKSVGSGYYVRLALKLKNTTSNNKTIELPAGLIIKSRSGTYQNGVLLKKVTFTIEANETVLTDLYMYCGNAQKSSSSTTEKYDLAVISNSSSLHELIDLLKNKKINIEQYLGQEDGLTEYGDIVGILQNCLWDITDSEDGLSEYDREFIAELPND